MGDPWFWLLPHRLQAEAGGLLQVWGSPQLTQAAVNSTWVLSRAEYRGRAWL